MEKLPNTVFQILQLYNMSKIKLILLCVEEQSPSTAKKHTKHNKDGFILVENALSGNLGAL